MLFYGVCVISILGREVLLSEQRRKKKVAGEEKKEVPNFVMRSVRNSRGEQYNCLGLWKEVKKERKDETCGGYHFFPCDAGGFASLPSHSHEVFLVYRPTTTFLRKQTRLH